MSPYTKRVRLLDLWIQEFHDKNTEEGHKGDDNSDNSLSDEDSKKPQKE